MPVLPNSRHEKFAQLLADGKTASEAYEEAGYKPNRGNAASLAKTEAIAARVKQINTSVAAAVAHRMEITAESLIDEVDEIKALAIDAGHYAVALNAVREKGILSGKRIERSEQGLPGEFAAVADDVLMDDLRSEAAQLGISIEDGATAH